MNELLRAYCLLEREHLLTNTEKAAKVLGIWDLACKNSNDRLWEMAHDGSEPDPAESSVVGSEPVLEIKTEDPVGGQRPGVRPTVKHTRAKQG